MSSNQESLKSPKASTKRQATQKKDKTAIASKFQKYSKTSASSWIDPSSKLKPSDLAKPAVDIIADDYPLIIDFNNIKDNTFHIHSSVDLDQPLFQPSPKVVVFEDYAPFAIIERKLYFRNNDSVARRIKIIQPDTPFFEISSAKLTSGENLKQSKVAAGMEICYIIKFKPQEVRDYSLDLICETEREKFIVPVRAMGMRPRLTFPDEIHFGNCPMKTTTRKALLIQNIGSSLAEFTVRSNNPVFTTASEPISIEPGGSQMVELFFTPTSSQVQNGELEVLFNKGLRCYIAITGAGSNVDVSLSIPSLCLEPSYISLCSQKTLKIKNMSNLPISFTWKSFSNEDEEEAERFRLLMEINRMEEIELSMLRQRISDGLYIDEGNDSDNSDDGIQEQAMIPFSARAEEAALVRKYRNLRTALQNDPMQFVDDIFEISPVEGQVWANSDLEVTVYFRPDTAALFNCLAFLDISGRQDRLSLHLSGQGIGPHATLSFDVLDVGDVFVNNPQDYELSIINKGDIPAQWNFMSSLTKFGNKFDFSPKEGFLNPGQSQKIRIRFESDVLGEFSEYFRFALQGNEVMLVCQIKGHVVGPTFHFDCNSIDFGTVSFDYLHSTNLRLVNTSKISMVYNLHIPQDGAFNRREFNIEPSRGTLAPGEQTDVMVEFIPTTVKVYDYSLAVDVLGVGDMLLSIPVKAECVVSTVRLDVKEIDYGDCFIRYPYEQKLKLTNVSGTVFTKFEFLRQPSYTTGTATYEVEPSTAVIEPHESMTVTVRVVPVKLGQFKLPFQVNIAGSQEPPIQASMSFNCVGPKITVDATELKWGNVECLRDSVRSLLITNDSLISAKMQIFLKMARSKYDLSVRNLALGPGESHSLQVTANLDDTVVCKDEVHIIVEEGENLLVPLSAKGIGTTMHCQSELALLDLGIQLTGTTFERRIILENKGRRPQQLRWINKTAADENLNRVNTAKKLGKDPAQKLPKHLSPVTPIFSVAPEEITLRPRTATTFTFKGSSATIGSLTETFVLESRVGKERAMKQIVETVVKVEVVNPLLQFSVPEMDFFYSWERGVEAMIQKRPIVLTNATLIPLTFVLKTEVPFNLSSWEHTLEPNQSVEVIVEFDPLYKDDKTTHDAEKALVITYRGHTQKDSIPLRAQINFPNLKFDSQNVAFGCVLNDTNKVIKVHATNWSRVPVSYEWQFIEQKPAKGRGAAAVIPLHQMFDILPNRSILAPGESEDIEFTLFGNANSKVSGNMLCIVEGGPEYKFAISGEASTVSFAIDKSVLNFGKVIFTDKFDEELTITNNGKVNFNYSITPGSEHAADVLELIPASGKVLAGQSAKVIVRVRPGIPAYMSENILVQIAHFDALPVACYWQGIFPGAVVFLPRYKKIGPYGEADGTVPSLKECWDKFQGEVMQDLVSPDESLLPLPADKLPTPAKGNSSAPPVYPGYEMDMDPEDAKSVQNSVMSLTTSTKGPSQLLMEMEMHRNVLAKLLTDKLSEIRKLESQEDYIPSADPEINGHGIQVTLARHVSVESFVVANYICDFGNVICGQTKKKIFKITNASYVGQLNWSFDKGSISGSGFSIEPDKVQKLPEQGSVDFTVKFFARTNQKLGKKTCNLPMVVKGSPAVNIILQANVCIPDLDISSELLDFDKVQIGRSKKLYLRFHNTTPVTSHWFLRRVPGKDESKITLTPMEGSLKSGKKVVVEVEFIPTEARKYHLELQVKIDMNPKPRILTIIGEGTNAAIKFDPPHVELGPVLPFSEGEEKVVTVYNLTSQPIEFFSLDFDNVYKEEEAILAKVPHMFDMDGIYRSGIRNPGDGLPSEIMQSFEQLTQQDTDAANDTSANAENNEDGGDGLIIAPVRSGPAPRDDGLHQDILLLGPPISGISTMATAMSKRLQLPVLTVDGILTDVMQTKSDSGEIVRRALNRMSAAEQEAVKAKEAAMLEAAEASKNEAVENFKKQTKGKVKDIPPEVYQTEAVAAYEKYLESAKFSAQTLSAAILFRMTWPDVGYGCIIDGVTSELIDESLAAEALHVALPKLIVANITYEGGAESYSNHMGQLLESKQAEIENLKKGLDANKKTLLARMKKSPRGRTATPSATTRQTVDGDQDIVIAVPSGDEPWINTDTGIVMELDGQDFKALEENQRTPYLRQILYQQYTQLKAAESSIKKIRDIWDAEIGLKTERVSIQPQIDTLAGEAGSQESKAEDNAPSSEQPEGNAEAIVADTPSDAAPVENIEDNAETADNATAEAIPRKTLLYCEYESKVLPLAQSLFATAEVAPGEAETKEEENSTEHNPSPSEGEAVQQVENVSVKDFGVFEISLEGEESYEEIFNTVLALLPAPKVNPPDRDAVPSGAVFQVIRKPLGRSDRKTIRNFRIIPLNDSGEPLENPRFRWIIDGLGSKQFKIKFQSTDECKSDSSLAFEVLGTQQMFSLYCSGISEVPKINNDTRNLFMKRSRALIPGAAPPIKRFVIADNIYSFGPIQIFKKPDWRSLSDADPNNAVKLRLLESTNMDIVRISNNGRYKCSVDLYMEDTQEDSKGVFSVEPSSIEIEEGESKDVQIWAFPPAIKEYSSNLVAIVSNNPQPVVYTMKCWGVEPTVEVTGPWDAALAEAEAAVANCADKKLVKDLELKVATLKEALTIDFDRILIGKTESHSFDVKNTSMLPVSWELDLGDFKDSRNLSIVPSSGIIAPGTSVNIVLSFTSPDPLMLSGKFSLRYSDAEGGLDPTNAVRVGTKVYRVIAEAYNIQAVSLTSSGSEDGGNELDFGLMRVGDYSIKTLKIGNKGKYKIGYKFSFSKPTLQNLIKIEPQEGVVEPGNALNEVKFTLCSSQAETLLKGNRDIIVSISEPLTGEVVEKFNLAISANIKYNRFRMQPGKGMQFGAVRFDSDVRTKRIELRNEGQFAFAYVVCPSVAEYDELESLDVPAFSAYAFASPAGVRAGELGEGYLDKIKKGAGAGGKAAAAPAKGKGAPAGGSSAPASSLTSGNQWIQDPDELAPAPYLEEPLVVGSFTITPRMALVEPGQSVGIDIKFDPSSCVACKERLRFAITGADPHDAVTQAIRSFDVTGESCFPAIVTGDAHSIFEELEVVHSLADCLGTNASEGTAKFEKLPVGKVVYASTENLMAFGPVLCNSGKPIMERIRITNPTKVDTKVKFRVLSPEAAAEWQSSQASKGAAKDAKGGKDAKDAKGKGAAAPAAAGGASDAGLAFTCQPESWDIPPHESRFVNVYFNPTEIKSYRGVFIAEVDYQGTETSAAPATPGSGKLLNFDLAGSGTLPCVAIDQPTERTPEGACKIDFGKLHIHRVTTRKIVIRNDGAMPATCLFDISGENMGDFDFPAKGSSMTINPGQRQEVGVLFRPTAVNSESAGRATANIRFSVLQNQFDQYNIRLEGVAYACDAVVESLEDRGSPDSSKESHNDEEIHFSSINLADSVISAQTHSFILKSRSPYPLKFEVVPGPECDNCIQCVPHTGHLSAQGSKELLLSFKSEKPVNLQNVPVTVTLKKIEYKLSENGESNTDLWGKWDISMKSARPATAEDLAAIKASEDAWNDYNAKVAAENAKGKKGKPVGPPPPVCLLELGPASDDGSQIVYEIVPEPTHEVVPTAEEQKLHLKCFASADQAKYKCDHMGESITFKPTFMFQSTIHRFNFTNESNIAMPVKWHLDNIKRRGGTRGGTSQGTRQASRAGMEVVNIPCPFSIEPREVEVAPNSTMSFAIQFLPVDTDDFVYLLRGETLPAIQSSAPAESTQPLPFHIHVRGTAKRPLCHFDIVETPDYLNRRPANLKNENGVQSPIEVGNLKVVEVESIGLKTRNTFRFHVVNPTADNYDFIWESLGDPSPFWRCVQSAGMLFAGKRVEMIFEYLPEEVNVAEAFFKFRLPHYNLEQIFLFTGKIREPRVSFSTSRIDFHSVMLGGEGGSDVVYLENEEHLPFNFAFERATLMQLEGTNGDIIDIQPKTGTVPPHSRIPIHLTFHPQEEVLYNYNLVCDVKRKPNKLSFNVKGEGYSVHPLVQIEQSEEQAALIGAGNQGGSRFQSLRPSPTINYADFGIVQVLDSLSKVITISNQGKYNFDYVWDIESISSMLHLSGGKLGGTLKKGEEISYNLTFAPQEESSLDGAQLSFTVAGKYTYQIFARGTAVEPALRFSFMQHDFGPCFITSPGGSTVVEESLLRLVNHDPTNNISIECSFQKTRTMWVDCPPTVLEPGAMMEVPFRFAPRDAVDYAFVVPFVINGTSKVLVNVSGRGIHPRLELVNQSQHRINFGTVNVGSEVRKTIAIVNRSKKALPVQLIDEGQYGGGAMEEHCVSFSPRSEFVIQPRESANVMVSFSPTKRIAQFSEDLMIRYAGITRKLLNISGKAQGVEVSLDTDSLPFGVVVMDSQKAKHLTLENKGDLPITYQWMEGTFGKHFSIKPLSGKVLAGNETSFEVVFKPQFPDEDIRQDNIMLTIPGFGPLSLTCTGACVPQPNDNIKELEFSSLARKAETKSVKVQNPSDKDWYLSPSLQGVHWKVPHEFKVPAKGSADLAVTFFPLAMSAADKPHTGQLFLPLPDGSAWLYRLQGVAGAPESSGQVTVESAAKKPTTVNIKLQNWLNESQKFKVSVELLEMPSPATSIIAANAVEIAPHGTKEFPVRFVSFVEGNSRGKITFTNQSTGEYCYFDLVAKTTMADVLETITLDAPVRQTSRYVLTLENPLPASATVTMGSNNSSDWWSSDCKYIQINELSPFSGHSEANFEIEYRPLLPTTHAQEHLLTIFSKELGAFKYKLVVTASPPSLRQRLLFEVPLGLVQTEAFVFKAYNRNKTDFACSVKKTDTFSVAKSVTVEPVTSWEGMDVRVNVTYEPSAIGETSDVLTITSPDGGEYICELTAKCVAPLPQGPYNLVQGGGAMDITFRNPFSTAGTFAFAVDSPAFRLGSANANVPAKSEGKVAVTFDPQGDALSAPSGYIAAKLFITCTSKADSAPWVCYLRGKIDANAAANPAAANGKKK